MSYTKEIKREIGSLNHNRKCCDLALLATFYALLSEVSHNVITIKTENLMVGRKILILTKKYLLFEPDIEIKNKNTIIITIADKENIETLKNVLCLKSEKADIFYSTINPKFVLDDCCKRACVGGAFLVNGFIASPKKSYHLEITTHKKHVFDNITDAFFELGFNVKTTVRNNSYVLYLKNNEEISDFLNLVGAKRSFFRFVDTKLEKELKNDINRQLNCENANENKVISASLIQKRAIDKIIKQNKFDDLSEPLKKTAELRLNYPNIPLSELVLYSNEKITKSGLNHRLNKLISISENL